MRDIRFLILTLLLITPALAACKDWSCFTGFPASCPIGYHVSGANSTSWNCTADTGSGSSSNTTITNSTAWNKTNGYVILADTDDWVGIGETTPEYQLDLQESIPGWRAMQINASLPLIRLDREGHYEWDFGMDNDTYTYYSDFIFRDSSRNEIPLLIKAGTGNIGIGNIENPGNTLTVQGNEGITEYLEIPEDLNTEQDLKFVLGTDYAAGTAALAPWVGAGFSFNGLSYVNRTLGIGLGGFCDGAIAPLCFGSFNYATGSGIFASWAAAQVGGDSGIGEQVDACTYKAGGTCVDTFQAMQIKGGVALRNCELDADGAACDTTDAKLCFGGDTCSVYQSAIWWDNSQQEYRVGGHVSPLVNLTNSLGNPVSDLYWNGLYANTVYSVDDVYSGGNIYAAENFDWDIGNGSLSIGSLAGETYFETTSVGISAGFNNIEEQCTFIGNQAGSFNKGGYSTFVGYDSGFENLGKYSVGVGSFAGFQNDGQSSTMMGHQSGNNNLGKQVSVYGMYSGYYNEGNWTTGIGYEAVRDNTGDMALGVGYNSGLRNSGTYLIGVGPYAGQDNTGQGLIAIGYEAGKDNTGANVVAIGYEAGEANTENGQLIIKDNFLNPTPLIQGNFTSGNVGIGTTTPTERLHVEGNLKVTGIVNATNVTIGDPWTAWTNAENALYLTEDDGIRSNITLGGDVLPPTNNTHDLGSPAFYWRNVYATGIAGGGGGGGAGTWSDAGLLYTNGSRTVTGGNIALAWGNLTSTPTTLAGYGITNHLLTTDAGLLYTNGSRVVTGGDLSLAWANLTTYPTDCGANNYVYGFDDAGLKCRVDATGGGGSFSDAGLLYTNGTRPLTANWNVGPYNITARNIAVSEGILFNNTEFPANTSNAQTRPWSPDTDRLLVYEEFWGDAALTNLAILGTESVNTADTDTFGVHNFANAATNVTDGAYSITPSTATNVGFYYIYNVTNVFETRAKFLSVTSITGAVGLFTTFTTQALYNGASCGSFFNYTRGTAGTAYWYTTTCSARYNCTSTVTTIPVSITRYETFKILPRVNNGNAWVEFYINNALVANHTGATHPINLKCTAAWIGAWEESIEAVAKNLRVDYIYYDRVRA